MAIASHILLCYTGLEQVGLESRQTAGEPIQIRNLCDHHAVHKASATPVKIDRVLLGRLKGL